MTSIAIGYRAIHHKIKAVSIFNVNWKFVYVLSMVSFLMLLVFYIYLINQLTRGSYLIKNYNRDIDKLSAENRMLESQFAESGFLGNVQTQVHDLDFEKTTRVTYLELPGNALAQAK